MNYAILMRAWRAIWVLLSTCLILAAAYFITPIIYPFIFAWLIALMLNPLVNSMQYHLRFPRWLSVTAALALFVTAMLTTVAAVITRIIKEIITLSLAVQQNLEAWSQYFIQIMENEQVMAFIQMINSLYKDNPNIQLTVNNNISRTAETITSAVANWISSFLNGIISILSSLPNLATISIVVVLAAFFISKDWRRWIETITRLISSRIRKTSATIWTDLRKALFGYFQAQFIMISITAVVVIIGLLILQVPYAVTIGLLIGLVDMLPYLGVGFVMVPWIIYQFAAGDLSLGAGLAVLYSLVLIARQIIEPKVLATSVGLDPLVTLFAMFAGLKLFGVFGLIIGPVSVVLLSAIHRAQVFSDLRNYVLTGRR